MKMLCLSLINKTCLPSSNISLLRNIPKFQFRIRKGHVIRYMKVDIESGMLKSAYISVQKMLDYLSFRKSNSLPSKRLYLRGLYGFCKFTGKNPDQLAKIDPATASKLVQEYGDELRRRQLSIRTINTTMAQLKLFFKVNGIPINVQSYYCPSRYRKRKEYIPTQDEVIKMANCSGNLRDRALILTLGCTGLRNSTIRALRYRDIREELEAGEQNLLIPVYPEMKEFVPGACKGNIPYFTFTTKEATEAIKLYIEDRKYKWGLIGDDEPLFAPLDYKKRKRPLSGRDLQFIVKEAARKAGIKEWKYVSPHCLRKTCESFLRSQKNPENRLDPKEQEFFMGHILPGTQDAYFADKLWRDEMRKKFSRLSFGTESRPSESGRGKQKVVTEEGLEKALEEGWRVVCALLSGKVVVEKVD